MRKDKRSKYWLKMIGALDSLYPKGDKERGKALVFLAHIEMIIQGKKI